MTLDREPWLAEGWHGSHTKVGCGRRPDRPVRSCLCGKGLRLGPLVRLAGRRLPAGLPAGLLVPRGHRIPVHTCAAVCDQRPGAPPAPDQPAHHLALDALPLHHGHCPDHNLRCHRRRIQQLHLPGLLPGSRHFCRGLPVLPALSRLDDDDRRCLPRRVPDGGLRSRPGCRQGEGAVGGEAA